MDGVSKQLQNVDVIGHQIDSTLKFNTEVQLKICAKWEFSFGFRRVCVSLVVFFCSIAKNVAENVRNHAFANIIFRLPTSSSHSLACSYCGLFTEQIPSIFMCILNAVPLIPISVLFFIASVMVQCRYRCLSKTDNHPISIDDFETWFYEKEIRKHREPFKINDS